MEVISNTKGGQPTPKRHLQIQHEKSPGDFGFRLFFHACTYTLVLSSVPSNSIRSTAKFTPSYFPKSDFFLFANLTKAILGLDFRPLILPLLRHLYQLCVWFILIQDLRLIFCQDSFWQLKACISMVPRISENRAYFIGKSVMKFRKFKF